MKGRSGFTVLVRQGCHLCDDLVFELQQLDGVESLPLTLVDIDREAPLQTRYNADVPVLFFNGQELCKHFLDPVAVKKALRNV
ncbi:MAG: glutaredoxin family protein [bacterium]